MNALLIGGGGFIGSYVAKNLTAEGITTMVLDNFSSEFKQRTIKGAIMIDGDMLNKEILKSAMKDVTHICHGAYPHNINSRVDDASTVWQNITATVNIARIARQRKIVKFVYLSSRSVYGKTKYNPVDEKHPIHPVTTYGLCKAVCEEYLKKIFERSKTELCILRGFLVYGPGDRQSVVSKFTQRILKECVPIVLGDGSATRDFIHVEDMARAIVSALKLEGSQGTFNIGSGKETSLLQLIEYLRFLTGRKEIIPEFVNKDDWNVNDRCFADISQAINTLRFRPSVPLEDGLRQVIEEYQLKSDDMHNYSIIDEACAS